MKIFKKENELNVIVPNGTVIYIVEVPYYNPLTPEEIEQGVEPTIAYIKEVTKTKTNPSEEFLIELGYVEYIESEEEKAKKRREYLDSLQMSQSHFIQLIIYVTSVFPQPITFEIIKEVSKQSEEFEILFDYSSYMIRGNKVLDDAASAYGVTSDMLDSLFEYQNELLAMKDSGVPFDPSILAKI